MFPIPLFGLLFITIFMTFSWLFRHFCRFSNVNYKLIVTEFLKISQYQPNSLVQQCSWYLIFYTFPHVLLIEQCTAAIIMAMFNQPVSMSVADLYLFYFSIISCIFYTPKLILASGITARYVFTMFFIIVNFVFWCLACWRFKLIITLSMSHSFGNFKSFPQVI